MPFMDPAFAWCRSAATIFARSAQAHRADQPGLHFGVVLYARAASPIMRSTIAPPAAGMIELDLMTAAQRAELPEDEDITAADRLIVNSPTTTGLS